MELSGSHPAGLSSLRSPNLFSFPAAAMVAKNRKQSGKSPASQGDRDNKNLHVAAKSGARRAGREGKACSHPNGLALVGHRLGLSCPSLLKLGTSVVLGKSGALACYKLTGANG